MALGLKVYTFAEVAKHNRTEDCWLIIHGKVYDVTPFMDDHPGGEEMLLGATGSDATKDYDDINHSASAKELMNKYYIGEIDTKTIPVKTKHILKASYGHSPNKSNELVVKILQLLVPLIILGVAFGARMWTKTE